MLSMIERKEFGGLPFRAMIAIRIRTERMNRSREFVFVRTNEKTRPPQRDLDRVQNGQKDVGRCLTSHSICLSIHLRRSFVFLFFSLSLVPDNERSDDMEDEECLLASVLRGGPSGVNLDGVLLDHQYRFSQDSLFECLPN